MTETCEIKVEFISDGAGSKLQQLRLVMSAISKPANLRPIKKLAHAHRIRALNSDQTPLAPDMIHIFKLRKTGFIPVCIALKASDSLLDHAVESEADLEAPWNRPDAAVPHPNPPRRFQSPTRQAPLDAADTTGQPN